MTLENMVKAGAAVVAALVLFSVSQPAHGQPAGRSGPEAAAKDSAQLLDENKDTFMINFEDVELEDIIKNFSQITGKNFILEQVPKGKITIISPQEIPKDQAFKVFEAILNLNGYNLAETAVPNLYRIVRTGEVMRSNIPIYPAGRRPAVSDAFVTRFIPLDYLDAQEISNTIQPLLSKDGGSVVPYPPTNTLIMVDTSLNIERILRILKILDVPSEEAEFEIVFCRYAQASDLAGTLGQIFTQDQKQPQRAAPRQPERAARDRRKTTAAPAPQPVQASEAPLKIIAESRLNALILIGDPETLKDVKHVISLLDVDVGEKGLIHVYYCKNAVARDLASTLSSLAGGGGRTTTAGTTTTRRRTTRETSAMTAGATTGALMSPITTPTVRTTQTAAAAGPTSAVLSGLFTEDVKITADEPTNSLIIVASPQDWELIKQVLAKLDIPRRQVFVEAALLEITVTSGREFSSQMHGASELEDEGAVLGGTAFGQLNSLTLMSLLAQGTQLPSGLTVGALGRAVEVPGTEIQIPSVGMIVQMLAADSNVNVLSTPTILTMDNEEAEIQVGQRIPVPTGQTVSTGGLSSISISRENVGIILSILPQINESGTIRLEISTEISNAVASALGINVNTLGVTTSIKTANTTVVVKDAQTIVIGGLMEDRRNESISRIPFIGDIPVLGWLFKSKSKGKTKTNLVILLTPHIVRTDEEVELVRRQIHKDYKNMIMEENLDKKYPTWDEYFGTRYEEAFQKKDSGGPVLDLTVEGEPVLDEEIILPAPDEYEYEEGYIIPAEPVEPEEYEGEYEEEPLPEEAPLEFEGEVPEEEGPMEIEPEPPEEEGPMEMEPEPPEEEGPMEPEAPEEPGEE